MNKAVVRIAACLLMLPAVASAQQYFDPGLLQQSIESKPSEYQAVGARLGSFLSHVGAELVWAHNDNVFYQPDDEIGDSLWLVRPWANMSSDWGRHALSVNAWSEIGRYQDYDVQDYEDWALSADARVDVRHNGWFSFDASYLHLHEDRRSPDDRFGIKPTEVDYAGLGGGYDHKFNRLKAGFYYRIVAFDYDDNIDVDGNIIDNQARDRDQGTATLRADWQWLPGKSIFAAYAWNSSDYDQRVDAEGYSRSSDGHTFSAGMNFDLTNLLVGDLFASWSQQSYDDPRLPDVDGFGLGAGLLWTPTEKTRVTVRLAASPQETTQPGTSGYFSQLWSARLQHELRHNLLFNARVSWTDNDYETTDNDEGTLQKTEVTRAGLGLSYIINRNVFVGIGYTWEDQSSNNPLYNYEANRYFVTLGLEL